MIYVCSDIHGCAERFYTLLKEIKFSDTDTMYILGDIIDRNDDSIELLKYVMKKDNIHLLMGNHEEFMYSYLVRLNVLGKLDERVNLPNDIWLSDNNGGRITLNDFVKEPIDNKIETSIFLLPVFYIFLQFIYIRYYCKIYKKKLQAKIHRFCKNMLLLLRYFLKRPLLTVGHHQTYVPAADNATVPL